MHRHGPVVLRVCRAILGPVPADDAWSETFLAALRAYPDLRPDSNIEAWLVTIAYRKAIDLRRAEARREIPTEAMADVADQPSQHGRPSQHNQPGGWESDLWAVLKTLPQKQRETVVYHHLAGLPYAEVAEIVGGSVEAARRAAADGIAALRAIYRKETCHD